MISILILTKNEELDLPGCLASVAWSDDVHVFDSCSTDRTADIARRAGVHLAERLFDNYAAQRDAALEQLPFKYEWVFLLDGDERSTPELAKEMRAAVAAAPADLNAFRVRRRDYFLGAWLRHAQIMPFYTRLVRRGRIRYTRAVNEVLEVKGRTGDLSEPFDHHPFSKGLVRWVDKHNLYSTMEARIVAERSFRADASWKLALLGKDFHQRRRAQKSIFYSLPARPLVRWLYILLYRGGVLDGYPGLTYATLQAFYEYLIVLKTRELRSSQPTLHTPAPQPDAIGEVTSVPALVGEEDTLAESLATRA